MNVIPYLYINQIQTALTVSPEILLCISGIFCHKSKAKTGKEGRDAIEGVLTDSNIAMIKENKKTIDKIEHLFYSTNRTNVPIKRRMYLWKEMKN